jgi:cell division protein FtsZ
MVAGTDLCFVTSGMGGGTGSGACPVVAQVAREQGCLVVGIVTKPFMFEGKRRMAQAIQAIERLREHVDTVIVVSNDRLLEIIPDDTPIERAFAVADDILRQGVVGISDIIVKPGLINVDFADVRAIMSGAGTALMGIGIGSGKNAAIDAAAAAISSPLLDSTIENAKGVVFNISGGPSLSLNEVNQAAKLIYSTVEADANVIFGALIDDTLDDNISITVLATGFKTKESELIGRAQKTEPARQSTRRTSTTTRAPTDAFNDVRGPSSRRNAQPQQQTQTARQSASSLDENYDDETPQGTGGGPQEKLPSFLKSLKKKL